VFGRTGEIPSNKGELFRLFDNDYERIKKEIEYVPVSENFWDFKSEVLQHLAFSMIQTDVQKPTELWLTISKQRAEDILERWLRQREVVDAPTKAKVWLKDLRKYHLLQDAAKPGEIEFHHQLFQEYYAAEYLKIELERYPEWLQKQSGEPYTYFQHFYLNYLKWTECVAIVLSLMENEKNAVDLVEQALDVDFMLGARLARETSLPTDINIKEIKRKARRERLRGEIQLRSSDSVIEMIIKRFLPRTIEEKLLSLTLNPIPKENTYKEESVSFLTNILKTTVSYDIFWKTLHKLGNLRSEAAVPILLDFFPVLLKSLDGIESLDGEDLYLLDKIKDTLIQIHSEKACPDLIGFLQDKKLNSCTRELAAECLGGIGCKSAIPALIEASKDGSLDVRKSSIVALGNIGCKTCINTLEKASSGDVSVQWAAKLALAKLGVASESTIAELIDALELCRYYLNDPQDWKHFVYDDGSEVCEVCEETYYVDYEEEISWAAAEALAKLDGSILPTLKKSLFSNLENRTPHLEAAIYAISAIQSNCKFYNYEIEQQVRFRKADCSSLEGGEGDRPLHVTNNYIAGDQIQGDKIEGDKYTIDRVGNLNTGTVNIHGNQNGEQ
jgi:HEAT repeat protein